MSALSLIAVPLIGLLSYTMLLLVIEARRFIEQYPVAETVGAENSWVGDLAELSNPTFDGIMQAYESGQLDPLINFASEQATLLASTLSGLVLSLLITIVVTLPTCCSTARSFTSGSSRSTTTPLCASTWRRSMPS